MTTNETLAKAIDFTNAFVIQYYSRSKTANAKPTPENIHSELYKIYPNIDLSYYNDIILLMENFGYIEFKYGASIGGDFISELKPTNKGHLLYLNGGLHKEVVRAKKKDFLFFWGQVGVILAGIFAILEIIRSIYLFMVWLAERFEWISRLLSLICTLIVYIVFN